MRIIICALLFVVVSCKTTSKNTKGNEMKQLSFTTISNGLLFGDGQEGIEESRFTITDQKAWKALLNKMNKVNNVTSNFQELNIDFSEEMVVCIFDKVQTSGGISLKIDKVISKEDTVTVTYSIKKPGPRDLVTTVMTQPYHLIKIDKIEGNFTFINEDK